MIMRLKKKKKRNYCITPGLSYVIFRIQRHLEYCSEASSSGFCISCIFQSLSKGEAKLSHSSAMCISNVLFGRGKFWGTWFGLLQAKEEYDCGVRAALGFVRAKRNSEVLWSENTTQVTHRIWLCQRKLLYLKSWILGIKYKLHMHIFISKPCMLGKFSFH